MLRIADLNQVPILTILFSVLAVAGVYIFGQITYHLRNILLLGLVGGFLALILNPLVLFLQTWKVKRRGAAVAIVTFVALRPSSDLPSSSAIRWSTASLDSRTHSLATSPRRSTARVRLDTSSPATTSRAGCDVSRPS